jgi:glycosyltransferase involved in cell wall biosynthesis
MSKLRILMLHRQPSAVWYYRTQHPAQLLEEMGHEVTYGKLDEPYFKFLKPKVTSYEKKDWPEQWLKEHHDQFDILWVDRGVTDSEVGLFAGFKHFSKDCRMIVDFDDDFTQVPAWNQAYTKYQPGMEPYNAGLNHLKLAEMVTVSTPTLSATFADKAHRIHCLPNHIDTEAWDYAANSERPDDPHVRILYGGASGHYGDLDEAQEGIAAVIRRQAVPMRLICFGTVPAWVHNMEKELPGKILTLPWVPFTNYPSVIAWGGFDMALAPLKAHPFNDAKSNIKWLEAAVQGIPFVCSDIGPYADIPDECAVKVENTPARWAEAIVSLAKDKDRRETLSKAARAAVLADWTVDKNKDRLHTIIEETMSAPRIESLEDARLPSEQPA